MEKETKEMPMTEETKKKPYRPPEFEEWKGSALREALVAIKEVNDTRPHDGKGYEINDIIEEALSAPQRNCDRFATAEDAYKAFSSYCFNRPSEGKCVGCPIVGEGGKSNCFGAWLMAAAQEGGDHAQA